MPNTTEVRYIRIEDWMGNIYYPESGGSSTGGSIINGSNVSDGGITTSDGQTTSDSNASTGQAIIVTDDGSGDKNVISSIFSNLPFGKVSCDIRLKSSIGSGTNVFMVINCYYWDNTNQEENYSGILLSSTDITGNTIGKANEYVNIGLVTDFKGVATSSYGLKVEVILKSGSGATVHFDNMGIDKSFVGVTGTATRYV